MEMNKVGDTIAALRKQRNMTQAELGERLNVTFQAVSKWERGETLPDTALLPALAEALETSIDYILLCGQERINYRGKATIAQMAEGLRALQTMGEKLGQDNLLYRSAVEGINMRMNTCIEDAWRDEQVFECFVAEAVIQHIIAGGWVDPTDVKKSFRHERWRNIVLQYARQHGIR